MRLGPTRQGADELGPSWERFEALYRSSRDDLYAYVLTLLGDTAAAEDVTALAFERAYRRRRSFDRRRGEERGWLFGIARNAALDELRRRRRVASLTADPEDVREDVGEGLREDVGEGLRECEGEGEDEGEDEGEGEALLRRTMVRDALESLTPRERELIALKFHAGLTNGELASVLGVSESNAGTMLHRAVQKLRRAVNAPV